MNRAQFQVKTMDEIRHLCHDHWVQSGGEMVGDVPPDSGLICDECSDGRMIS
jgi:hypothetical protein